MAKAKSKTTTRPAVSSRQQVRLAMPEHPEAQIMRLCVQYARLVAGYHNGFEADPTGNKYFAAGGDDEGARDKLVAIAKSPATTAAGICAKARIVPMVLKDDGEIVSPAGADFYKSFAADVRAFTQPLCDQEYWDAVNTLTNPALSKGRAA